MGILFDRRAHDLAALSKQNRVRKFAFFITHRHAARNCIAYCKPVKKARTDDPLEQCHVCWNSSAEPFWKCGSGYAVDVYRH